ncbi:transposase [Desulfolithobacter dissulfuricans]|uniref:Transposase n=1 Tax=Desulfolithobacter dissulfuricans TaxID=2795293 RepID=A0A915U0E2_9BACT|nr:transposase [Desulfolithobacter dissulfuricans]BCO07979.1 transposase [Desulfolithobacter dissulfuricans]BCO09181.1 transposase [Desulfolithobacter dissulfuricans]
MKSIPNSQKQQEAIRLHHRIDSFFDNFAIGTLLNRAGIRKIRGASPLVLLKAIFVLPFENNNFFRSIVAGNNHGFKKDAAYQLLKNPRYNWRKLLLLLAAKLVNFCDLLTDCDRKKVLIIDDSTYDRSHSKFVELLARVHDHTENRFLNGFKMLSLGWSDGATFLPLDFSMLSSANSQNRLQGITKKLDKRSIGYKRRQEAMTKATELLVPMIKRVLAAGIDASHILMDSWFAFPSVIQALSRHRPVICMLKDMPTILYRHCHTEIRLGELYKRIKKRRGKAKILASVIVETRDGLPVKIVFVRHRQKRGWLAILSTDLELSAEEIVRIYGKRWDIEVFFKMAKHYLNLEREMQLRDYDGLIGHTTIVMLRYLFLAFEQRLHDDPRTLGSLFYACSDELQDLSVLEALQRILSLALDKIRKIGVLPENIISNILDAVMSVAIDMLKPPAPSTS